MVRVKVRTLLLLLVLLAGGLFLVRPVEADVNCDGTKDREQCLALNKQINDLSRELQMLRQATAPLETEVKRLDASIKSIQAQINTAVKKQKELEKGIADREERVTEHYIIFAKKTRELYKKKRASTILVQLLSTVGVGGLNREIAYQTTASNQDKQLIIGLSEEILSLEEDKKELDDQKAKLSILQANLDKQADFFKKEVASAKKYQTVLSGQISTLSALQQSILGEKQETFQTTVGDVPLEGDPNSLPNYNPGFSPAFAAFSFGAPHFKGMSQYGAFGRAKAGQGVEEILRAYYGGGIEIKKDYDVGKQIHVRGCTLPGNLSQGNCASKGGSWIDQIVDLETYVKRIYEMPGSWTDNDSAAMKAQAVASRSYALARTNEGAGEICPSEDCQVYKQNNKGGAWDGSVDATRGWVLMAGGKPFSAWYASTSGGYQESYSSNGHSTPGFWDAVGGRGGWTSQAYEVKSGSPWFYKGWYKSRSGASCGRSHPWLTSEEMADILNAWVVRYQGGGDSNRVVPVDAVSCWGKGDPYSTADLKNIGGYSSVGGVSVTYSDGGYTANVTFSTNRGDLTIKGSEFKEAFNLRAPGRVALKSGLFNVERK